jgi:hypothetical protein
MLSVVQPLIDADILYKVLDEAGGSVFHLPFPPPNGQWSNTIGNIEATEGYYTKVTGDGELCMEGFATETPLEIPLTTGWNIISYPCAEPQNALNAVQPLIDAGVLYKVIDEAGGSIFHLPFPPPNGQWSNTLGNFESGEGYYVKVSENSSVTIDCSDKAGGLTSALPGRTETSYFSPVFDNNPYMPMHIVLNNLEGLNAGDEIAVFDGNSCVGAAVYEDNNQKYISIIASQSDTSTKSNNGFDSGNPVRLMIWNNQSGDVNEIDFKFVEGYEVFTPLETMVADFKSLDEKNTSHEVISLKVFPNPVNNFTNLLLFLDEESTIKLRLEDMNGHQVLESQPQIYQQGNQSLNLNTQHLKKGVYIIGVEVKTMNSTQTYYQRIIKL